jgi:hypothetical protein
VFVGSIGIRDLGLVRQLLTHKSSRGRCPCDRGLIIDVGDSDFPGSLHTIAGVAVADSDFKVKDFANISGLGRPRNAAICGIKCRSSGSLGQCQSEGIVVGIRRFDRRRAVVGFLGCGCRRNLRNHRSLVGSRTDIFAVEAHDHIPSVRNPTIIGQDKQDPIDFTIF